MRHGIWGRIESSSVEGKTLGILGLGRIGFEVARRAWAFGMEIIYTDPSEIENIRARELFKVRKASFDELLAESDFLSLHTPLTSETSNLFCYETICRMKNTAFLINTARGAIIDENGLARALSEGRIAGAAIDVYDVEPNTGSPLRNFSNVILTPHIGTFTKEIFIKMDILAAKNIVEFFNLIK
jgi:D-3-phosphoglycerate dehydrogenase